MRLCIRPFELPDAPAVLAAINAVCAERVYLLTDRYVPTPQWEAALHEVEAARHLLLVPVWDDQVIGWCRVFGGTLPKTWHVAEVGIGLLAPYREQGIGTATMKRAIAWATDRGFRKIVADTFASNARARALFRSTGFVETGVRRAQFQIEGRYVDQILVERPL